MRKNGEHSVMIAYNAENGHRLHDVAG